LQPRYNSLVYWAIASVDTQLNLEMWFALAEGAGAFRPLKKRYS